MVHSGCVPQGQVGSGTRSYPGFPAWGFLLVEMWASSQAVWLMFAQWDVGVSNTFLQILPLPLPGVDCEGAVSVALCT